MRRLWVVAAMLGVCWGIAVAQTGSPEAPVSEIYAHYADPAAIGFFVNDPAARPLFSGRMNAQLDREEALVEAEGIGNLDFDPFVDGQDFAIGDLRLSSASNGQGRATVEARFTNFGADKRVVFDMVAENGGWRIDDVSAPDGDVPWRLSDILDE